MSDGGSSDDPRLLLRRVGRCLSGTSAAGRGASATPVAQAPGEDEHRVLQQEHGVRARALQGGGIPGEPEGPLAGGEEGEDRRRHLRDRGQEEEEDRDDHPRGLQEHVRRVLHQGWPQGQQRDL